jgi:hypothetical protein
MQCYQLIPMGFNRYRWGSLPVLVRLLRSYSACDILNSINVRPRHGKWFILRGNLSSSVALCAACFKGSQRNRARCFSPLHPVEDKEYHSADNGGEEAPYRYHVLIKKYLGNDI